MDKELSLNLFESLVAENELLFEIYLGCEFAEYLEHLSYWELDS